jgi:protein-tyrosine-phosphatase
MSEAANVLFVCTANICRSPFAEALARLRLGPDAPVVLASAGTHAREGVPLDPPMAARLEALGGVPGRPSRPLTMTLVDEADLVVVMERRHREFILDDRPLAAWKTFVLGQVTRMEPRVPGELTGRDFLTALRAAHLAPTAEDDIDDPYRRGDRAAAAVAGRIEALLEGLLRRLAGSSE